MDTDKNTAQINAENIIATVCKLQRQPNKHIHNWTICKNDEQSRIQAYEQKNPISSSYEQLWKDIKDQTSTSLITIQNNMRRILENYFGMLGELNPQDELEKCFTSVEEKLICRSLFAWINDG